MSRALLLATTLLAAGAASAAERLQPRATAFPDADRASIGVFAPLRYATDDGLSVRVHPLLFLVSPNAELQVNHRNDGDFAFATRYALSVPSPLMHLSRGYLFPTAGREIGWIVVGRFGALASWRMGPGVLTGSADAALNLLGDGDLTPLGAPAPLELLMAPAAAGSRLRAGLRYDWPLGTRLGLGASADAYRHPAGPLSPFTLRAGASVDVRVGERNRFTVGAVYFNQDQGRVDQATGRRRRNNDVLPTADFIWAW